MQPLARFQALVIGVGSYDYYVDLPETVNDATQLRRILVDPLHCGYPPNRVRLLVGREATVDNILAGLERLALETVSDTTTIVYFSGHGGFSADSPQTIYLCPAGANPARLSNTALSSDVFSRALAQIKTRRLVVILDACHASGAASFKGAAGREDSASDMKAATWISAIGQQFAQYHLREGSGRVIFASSRREQASWVYPSGHMSLFTFYLIEGLKGSVPATNDGLIRVFDLFHYVGERVRAKRPAQEPVLAAQDVTLNFPIALHGGRRKDDIATDVYAPPASRYDDDLGELRERIIRNTKEGIVALARYLKTLPIEFLELADTDIAAIDLKLAEFFDLDKRIHLLGEKPDWVVSRTQIVYYFISLCVVLQRSIQE